MLQREPSQRPTIHQVLKHPLLSSRIKQFLENSVFRDEFSHTLLHNQNVFEEFKAKGLKKKAEEEKAKRESAEKEKLEKERAETEAKMAALNLGGYQPP